MQPNQDLSIVLSGNQNNTSVTVLVAFCSLVFACLTGLSCYIFWGVDWIVLLYFFGSHIVCLFFYAERHVFLCNVRPSPPPPVPAGSPSRGGDVMVYVLDVNHPSLPNLFILFLCLFLSLWAFQLYFIP